MVKSLYLIGVLLISVECLSQPSAPLSDYVSIRSIDPHDDDYSDLIPLINRIGNAKVVALGESTHDSGNALRAKSRLVKFLHDKMGFDVLLFEYAFYGGTLANELLKTELDLPSAIKSMNGWISEEVFPDLYQYIRNTNKTSNPLVLGGFDDEKVPMGVSDNKRLLNEVSSKMNWLNLSHDDMILMDSLIQANGRLGNPVSKAFSKKGESQAIELIHKIIKEFSLSNEVSTAFTPKQIVEYPLFLKSLLMTNEERNAGGFWNLVRDKNMATRFFWHYNTLNPGKKVILWGASVHFAHDLIEIERDETAGGFYPYNMMGDYIKRKLVNDFYTIAITSYQGSRGQLYPDDSKYKSYEYSETIEKAPFASFEQIAHSTSKPYLFIDLRKLPKSHPLTKSMVAVPFGHKIDRVEWKKVIDAFLFVDEETPIKN